MSIPLLFLWAFVAGGQAKTLMFVQLNPDVESYSETISTLKFAERVSGVELGAARSNKEGRGVRELMEQVIIQYFEYQNFKTYQILSSVVEFTLKLVILKLPDLFLSWALSVG